MGVYEATRLRDGRDKKAEQGINLIAGEILEGCRGIDGAHGDSMMVWEFALLMLILSRPGKAIVSFDIIRFL